jgi:hypothetical protein
MCFSTPDGKAVLEHLESRFNRSNLVKKVNGVVDPNATLVSVGELRPITEIQERMENGKLAR